MRLHKLIGVGAEAYFRPSSQFSISRIARLIHTRMRTDVLCILSYVNYAVIQFAYEATHIGISKSVALVGQTLGRGCQP